MIAPDIVLAYLESLDPKERETGLAWVGRYNMQNFLGDALRLLHDRVSNVREKAAQTLGRLGNPTSIEPLAAALHDQSYTVRFAAGWALVDFGTDVIPYVKDVLQSESKHARVAAFQVLSRLDSDEARAVIRRYWDDNRT